MESRKPLPDYGMRQRGAILNYVHILKLVLVCALFLVLKPPYQHTEAFVNNSVEPPKAQVKAVAKVAVKPTKPKSDIPSRVFCGSPKQRNWKTPIRENVVLGKRLAEQRGWKDAEWSALLELWSCESSWNNLVKNPDSTAYGIGQFLNSTWSLVSCRKSSDPQTQIKCGLDYIAKTQHKTPSRALKFHYANNWY